VKNECVKQTSFHKTKYFCDLSVQASVINNLIFEGHQGTMREEKEKALFDFSFVKFLEIIFLKKCFLLIKANK
jgi:hypothetical protein